jgi:hypothetical protein
MLRGQISLTLTQVAAPIILKLSNLLPAMSDLDLTVSEGRVVAIWILRSFRTAKMDLKFEHFALDEILARFSNSLECSNEKDRIFGLLGLTKDVNKIQPHISYSSTYAEILLDLSHRMMTRLPGFKPLAYWKYNLSEDDLYLPSNKHLPTWVSRWQVGAKSILPAELQRYDPGDQDEYMFPGLFSADRYELNLVGTTVATVKSNAGDFWEDLVSQAVSLDNIQKFESVVAQARSHLQIFDNADAIILNTILKLEESPNNDDDTSAETLKQILKLMYRAASGAQDLDKPGAIAHLRFLQTQAHGDQQGMLHEVLWRGLDYLMGRSICLLTDDQICLCPVGTRADDVIVAVVGAPTIYVFRPTADNKCFYVGDAFMVERGLGKAEPRYDGQVEVFTLI